MIVNYYEQGGLDWVEARLGIPTASQFGRIITPAGNLSKSRERYIGELCSERFERRPFVNFNNEWTERGQVLEPDAARFYQFTREAEIEKVGLIYPDESRQVGGSPDGLVGEEGGIEIKCPDLPMHIVYSAEEVVPRVYMPQVQGLLWISKRAWWDFMSFYPGKPRFVVRVEPDEQYHAALDKHMPVFLDELTEKTRELVRQGWDLPVDEFENLAA